MSYLRTHWWVLALEVVCIFSISIFRYYQSTPVYRASSAVLIDNTRRSYMTGVMMSSMNSRKQNIANLLTSHDVMSKFEKNLEEFYKEKGRPPYLRPYFAEASDKNQKSISPQVNLNWDRMSDIYHITCEAPHPDAARVLCWTYLNTIQTYYPEIGQREALLKKDFLSKQISFLSKQIAEKELVFSDFQRNNEDFLNYLLIDVEGNGKNKLQAQLATIQESIAANRATKKLLLNVPSAKRGEHTALQITITSLVAKQSDLQYQYQLTDQSQDPNRDARLLAIKREMELTSAQLAKLNDEEIQAYVKNPLNAADQRKKISELELDYRVFEIKKNNLEKQIKDITLKEKNFAQKKLEYQRMAAELKLKRQLLSNLYAKEQHTEIELSAGSAEIYRLQEPAKYPPQVAPQWSKFLYVSLSLSIFVCAVSILMMMAAFPRLDSEEEVNRLNLPILGKLPYIKFSGYSLDDIPSIAHEFLKIMNYRIHRETKDMQCPIVVVTSAHSREGKSTMINLLAMTSFAKDKRVLVIDGDLLTVRPNHFLGIQEDQTFGVKAIVDKEEKDNLQSLIVRTRYENLFFMPRGQRADAESRFQSIKPMEEALQKLRKEYDLIFIDTPPLFASTLSHQWISVADLIVIVARLFVTSPRDLTEGLQLCKTFSKAPIGVAMNCMKLSGAYRRASNYYFSRKKTKPDELAA